MSFPSDFNDLGYIEFEKDQLTGELGALFSELVSLDITTIDLKTEAEVPGIDAAKFQELAESAKKNCPVSRALAGTTINLQSTLVGSASAAS